MDPRLGCYTGSATRDALCARNVHVHDVTVATQFCNTQTTILASTAPLPPNQELTCRLLEKISGTANIPKLHHFIDSGNDDIENAN